VRIVLALTAALLITGIARADEATDPAESASMKDRCPGEGIIAKIFMGQRQRQRLSLSDMMGKWESIPGAKEKILEAFEVPLMMTPQTRQMAIDEFENRWALKCYKRAGASGAGEPPIEQ
jgi:hypothetical protein